LQDIVIFYRIKHSKLLNDLLDYVHAS